MMKEKRPAEDEPQPLAEPLTIETLQRAIVGRLKSKPPVNHRRIEVFSTLTPGGEEARLQLEEYLAPICSLFGEASTAHIRGIGSELDKKYLLYPPEVSGSWRMEGFHPGLLMAWVHLGICEADDSDLVRITDLQTFKAALTEHFKAALVAARRLDQLHVYETEAQDLLWMIGLATPLPPEA